jgi:hypothetical protein
MKKLVLGLIATVMFGFLGNAQTFSQSKVTERTFKFLNVIALLETKSQFEQSKNADEFVVQMSKGVRDAKTIELLSPYLKSVYSMHQARYTQDNAYDKINMSLYYTTFENLSDYVESNPKALTDLNNSKSGFFNLLRKIIDLIDDYINGTKPNP